MKTCKINLEKRNDVFKVVGTGLLLASFVAGLLEEDVGVPQFLGMIGLSVWFIIMGVCDDEN